MGYKLINKLGKTVTNWRQELLRNKTILA